MNLSRRFFLGGAISLVAAKTFIPSVSAMSNLPTIRGDGIHDDSSGLGSLFRNEPVTFYKEQLGVDSHDGIVFHRGRFAIKQTINLQKDVKLKIEHAIFIGLDLEPEMPFFCFIEGYGNSQQFDGPGTIFELKKGAPNRLIAYAEIKKYL